MITRLRHVALVNPPSRRFDRLGHRDTLPFLPMESVWPDGAPDLSQTRPKADVVTGYSRFEPGDVVVPKIMPTFGAGRAMLIPELPGRVGAGTTELHVVRPGPGIDPRYLLRIFHGHEFLRRGAAELHGVAGQQRVPDELIRDWPVDLPDLAGQRRVAAFLDAETARTSALTAARRAQLALLATRRFALVRELLRTGTAGAPVRRTGLGWLPSCPAHWPLTRLRYVTECLDGRRVPLSGTERAGRRGPYPYYGASAVVDHVDGWLFDEELVLLGEDGAALGNPRCEIAWAVSGRIWVNNHAHVLRPRGIAAPLLAAILNVFDRELCLSGSTREKITQDAMNALLIPVPPAAEQATLVRLLAARRAAADDLEQAIVSQIALVEERHRALITATLAGRRPGSTDCSLDQRTARVPYLE